MQSIILRKITHLILSLMLIYSLFVLLRGHNEPGGGFIGGLVAASAFSLYALTFGTKALKHLLVIDLGKLLGIGLGCALFSGLPGLIQQAPFMASRWLITTNLKLGTPLLFDIGIYIIIIAAILQIILALEDVF